MTSQNAPDFEDDSTNLKFRDGGAAGISQELIASISETRADSDTTRELLDLIEKGTVLTEDSASKSSPRRVMIVGRDHRMSLLAAALAALSSRDDLGLIAEPLRASIRPTEPIRKLPNIDMDAPLPMNRQQRRAAERSTRKR